MERCAVCGIDVEYVLFEHVLDDNKSLTDIMICPSCSVLHNSSLENAKLSERQAMEFQASAVQSIYHISDNEIHNINTRVDEAAPILTYLLEQSDIPVKKDVYLEVGAGAGYVAAAATRVFSKVFAVELDPRELSKTFRTMGLSDAYVLHSLKEFDNTNDKADCVVLWHTLEHIPKPAEFLCRVRETMRQDGVIYFQVPLYRKPNVFPAHIWFFNARAIKFLRSRVGFAREKIVFDTRNDFMSVVFW